MKMSRRRKITRGNSKSGPTSSSVIQSQSQSTACTCSICSKCCSPRGKKWDRDGGERFLTFCEEYLHVEHQVPSDQLLSRNFSCCSQCQILVMSLSVMYEELKQLKVKFRSKVGQLAKAISVSEADIGGDKNETSDGGHPSAKLSKAPKDVLLSDFLKDVAEKCLVKIGEEEHPDIIVKSERIEFDEGSEFATVDNTNFEDHTDPNWSPPSSRTPSPKKVKQDAPPLRLRSKRKFNQTAEVLSESEMEDQPKKRLYYLSSCSQCSSKFKGRHKLLQHVAEVHENLPMETFLQCTVCQEVQKDLGELRRHLQDMHENEKNSRPKSSLIFCVFCPETFVTEQMRDLHTRDIHSTKQSPALFCEIEDCLEKYMAVSDFNEHLKKHLNPEKEEIFVCEKCGRQYLNKYRLQLHKLLHTEKDQEGFHHCTVEDCDVKYLTQNKLLNHFNQAHIDEENRIRLHICDLCKLAPAFLAKQEKEFHVKRHAKKITCQICQITFTGLTELTSHQYKYHNRTNPGQEKKNFSDTSPALNEEFVGVSTETDREETDDGISLACVHCSEKFKTFNELDRHKRKNHRIFDSRMELVCEECGVKVVSRSALTAHVKKSHGEFKFHCPHCSNKFRDKWNMKMHIESVHNMNKAERPYVCEICGKGYVSKGFLNGHMKLKHSGLRYICQYCSKELKTVTQLNQHITASHTSTKFDCPWCPAEYSWATKLSSHVRKAHPDKEWGRKSSAAHAIVGARTSEPLIKD